MQIDPETDLILNRVLNAPRAAIWTCWTQPAHLKQFFIPKPHTISACEIDLRVGGVFNTTFVIEGAEMPNTGVYLEIDTGHKLVFTDTYGANWKPAADPFMTAIITLADAPNGATQYTAIARHRSTQARQSHEDMGFHVGWGIVADQLEAYANTL